jgi:hypothetical protein
MPDDAPVTRATGRDPECGIYFSDLSRGESGVKLTRASRNVPVIGHR